MASIAKILPHLEKGERSPDSSDNGFESFGSGSASSPERNNSEPDHHQHHHFISTPKNSESRTSSSCIETNASSGSDSGRVSSPDDAGIEEAEVEIVKSPNNFRPWEDEAKSKSSEPRVPELGLHQASNFAFGLPNFRLPFIQGIPPFQGQFNPFSPAQLSNQQFTIQQFLQQSNIAQNYVTHQKAYAALRIKSEYESLQSQPHQCSHQAKCSTDCCSTMRPWSSSAETSEESKPSKANNGRTKKKENGNKPYKCPICEAQFNRPANLKTHLRIHSGEKPYKCDTCGARFVQVAHLRAHVLIHTGEKPYPCQICGTRFRHLQTLKSHIRIHTGEKPFSCDECSLRFRHKSQLRLHLRTKHGINTNTKKSYTFVPGLNSADLSKMIKDNSKSQSEEAQSLNITEVN